MIKAEAQHLCQTIASPVNVLFVACEDEFVNALIPQLTDRNLTWGRCDYAELRECIDYRVIVGSVVFGESVADCVEPDELMHLLTVLQTRHIAAYLNGPAPEAISNNPLATAIRPETVFELPARLETAAQYARQHQSEQPDGAVDSDIADQLEMAGQVQRNFLPSRLPHTEHIRWGAMFRPAQWVSGDIYDIARLDEKHIGFYLADAVGHSMPAALLTIFLKQSTVMRQTFGNDYRICPPDEVVSQLNQRMAQQEFSGCLFATCCYGLLNIETYELQLARAGHPYPVLIRDGELICLQSRGGLLGVFGEAKFEVITMALRPGDKLMLYSDGGEPLIGQSKDDGTLTFNEDFRTITKLPIDQMIQAYDQMAQQYRFKPGESDDVTAIGLEITP